MDPRSLVEFRPPGTETPAAAGERRRRGYFFATAWTAGPTSRRTAGNVARKR